MTAFHIAAALLDTVMAVVAGVYLEKRRVPEIEQETAERQKGQIPCTVLLCFLIAILSVLVYAYGMFRADKEFLQALRDSVIVSWTLLIGYIDWKEHIIPNALILMGIGFWVLLSVVEVTAGGTPLARILGYSSVGFFVVGFVLLAIALIAKSALGMGDVKLFAVLGLFYGLFGAYSILLFSAVTMALVSLALLLFRKVTAKTALPMAPFAFFGLLVYLLSGA